MMNGERLLILLGLGSDFGFFRSFQDIAKVDAPLVLSTLKRWKNSKKQNEKEMSFIVNHALRTLIKDGNVEALEMLGYQENPNIEVDSFTVVSNRVKVGEALEFSFNIRAKEEEALMVDYVVHFQTKTGKKSAKVHKLKKLKLKKDEQVKLNKKHPFKANMSTRKLYAGEHKLDLQINGKVYQEIYFELEL